MTFQEFDAQLEQTFTEIRLLGDDKGREYANNDQEDRLANFTRIAKAYNVSATLVCAIYLEKHLDAIRSYVRLGKTLSEEKIEGRIRDAQLYLSLLEALISDLKVIDQPTEQVMHKILGTMNGYRHQYLCMCGALFHSSAAAQEHLQAHPPEPEFVQSQEPELKGEAELEPFPVLSGCWWLKNTDAEAQKKEQKKELKQIND